MQIVKISYARYSAITSAMLVINIQMPYSFSFI